MSNTAKPKLSNPRHPEGTLLYQTVAEHYETWLELASAGQFDGQGDQHSPQPFVRQAFEKYLQCGIFAHGFARARCDDCGHDHLVAFSCKGRGVCPSCTTRRMAETAAHLSDHVFPRLPVRQWVLSVPKRLRYFIQRDGAVLGMVLRKRILRAFVGRGLLERVEAREMLGYRHSGFSLDTSVCIAAQDRTGLERLLRYCARPPFALQRLRKAGSELVYHCARQHTEPGNLQSKQIAGKARASGKAADELHLTPLELIDRLAALVPPPRAHRHRYYGVLAPNSPLRATATELAAVQPPAYDDPGQSEAVAVPGVEEGACTQSAAEVSATEAVKKPANAKSKRPANYLWAVLIARIYEVFPLLCPICGGQMRIIAFITYSDDIRHILAHIGNRQADLNAFESSHDLAVGKS